MKCSLAAALNVTLLLGGSAVAQTATTPISLSLTGTAVGTFGGGGPTLKGTGSLSPYGPMTFVGGESSFTFTLSDGDSIQAQAAVSGSKSTVSVTLTIQSGTGAFIGAQGSAQLTLTCDGDCVGQKGTAYSSPFVGSGSGSLILPSTPVQTELDISEQVMTLEAMSGLDALQNMMVRSIAQNISQIAPRRTDRPRTTVFNGPITVSAQPNEPWLSVSPSSKTIPAGGTAAFTVTAGSSSLVPGAYQGSIALTANGAQSGSLKQTVTVNLLVTSASANLAVSQSGLLFNAGAGGPAPPAQTVVVSTNGSGSIPFSATGSTLSGGNWLSVDSAATAVAPGSPASINISVNPSGLTPGDYFGRVDLAAPDAGNSPQSVEIALRVAGGVAPVTVAPSGLIFGGAATGSIPPQTIQVSNPSNVPVSVTAAGSGWLTVTPSGVASMSQPLSLTVQANPAGLSAGVYEATLNVVANGANYPVTVVLLVFGGEASAAVSAKAESACTPTQLGAVFTNLGQSFQTPAGLPAPLQALVMDDCGNPLNSGTVVASFSSNDPSVTMQPIGNGQWAGTWLPHNTAGGSATVVLYASSSSPVIAGTAQLSGQLTPNLPAPVLSIGGEVSAAGLTATPLAPGAFISLFGSNLATGLNAAPSLPLPDTIAGTQVILGGQPIPLQFVSANQINAIVPYGLPVNAALQLSVQQNGYSSLPETVILAAAQPAVFTQNQSGQGAGIIVDVQSDGSTFEVTTAHPAGVGDAVVIYCAGLGELQTTVTAGSAAPSSPLPWTGNPVTVTIGGQAAKVLYAGLAPGFAGLYQVDAIVPAGIAAAADVPLVLSVGGISSPPVTMAIQ